MASILYIGPQREAGPFAIETYQSSDFIDSLPSRFEIAEFAVVYADKGQPSHCVRQFVFEAEGRS